MQLETLKKIIDIEDRTTRHEHFKRWIHANVTVVQSEQSCIGLSHISRAQRDMIIEALAGDIAVTLINDNHVTISNKGNTVIATASLLRRLM